jgi:hypothetical protein
MTQTFEPGEEVFHASNPKIIMVVETIQDREVYCSWLDPKTSEKRDGNFSAVTLRKVDKGPLFRTVTVLP